MNQFFKQSKLILLGLLSLTFALESNAGQYNDCSKYENMRNFILETENLLAAGSGLQLSYEEMQLNAMFMAEKYKEMEMGLYNYSIHSPALHFFKAKPLIEESKIFKLLKQMPKGAVLHLHFTASVSSEWLVQNLSYTPGLLRCTNRKGVTVLTFRKLPEKHDCQTEYVAIEDERKQFSSAAEYDKDFEKLVNLYTPFPELEYPNINLVWQKFQNMFTTIGDALRYINVFRTYCWQMLQEMYEDNIMYGEIRLQFKQLYDLNGKVYPEEQYIVELLYVEEQFKLHHDGFLGIKIIYTVSRDLEMSEILKHLEKYEIYREKYPDVLIGVDLAGQEDIGTPLHNLLDVISYLTPGTKFFFHAGESNWHGTSSDINLLDAILLNATRIGHGYALVKHPLLWQFAKNRHIAIEISPISNQVLHLVWDLRNHPAAIYLSQDVPIVISNDDPGFWNSKGLSYDYYYAIMSMAPANAGLKLLKYLVWNSIKYSVLTALERKKAYELLEMKWREFVMDQIYPI